MSDGADHKECAHVGSASGLVSWVLEGYEPEQVSLPTVPTLLPGGNMVPMCQSRQMWVLLKHRVDHLSIFHQPVLLSASPRYFRASYISF